MKEGNYITKRGKFMYLGQCVMCRNKVNCVGTRSGAVGTRSGGVGTWSWGVGIRL